MHGRQERFRERLLLTRRQTTCHAPPHHQPFHTAGGRVKGAFALQGSPGLSHAPVVDGHTVSGTKGEADQVEPTRLERLVALAADFDVHERFPERSEQRRWPLPPALKSRL